MAYRPADITDRIHSANREFQNFDFGRWVIADYDTWKHDSFDGNLIRTVYFENGGKDAVKGFFVVRFEPGNDAIRDSFCTVDGNEIIPTVE